jgi:hypothetical protein
VHAGPNDFFRVVVAVVALAVVGVSAAVVIVRT